MTLNAVDHPVVRGLLRTDVEATTASLKYFIKRSRWIGKTNRYTDKVVKRLQQDHPLSIARKRNLSQYIAASTFLHSTDGWSYLGRSLDCLLQGDSHRALHLAYYAELRATMSLLAGSGLGIFKNRHYVISGKLTASRLDSKSPTHEFVWSSLHYWSKQAASGELFANVVRPEGRSLYDWFQPHGGNSSLAAQARQWFLQWGMDLRFASKDRDARNESSYRPDGIPASWQTAPAGAIEFVTDAWRLLEPSTPSSFGEIDRHILRLALERHYRATSGVDPKATDQSYIRFIEKTVEAQSFAGSTEERLKHFLLRNALPTDPSLFVLSKVKPSNAPTDCVSIAARAILLLRLAAGSAQDLLSKADIKGADLSFWLDSVGEGRGLWHPGDRPESLSDLWADVRDVLADVDASIGYPPTLTSIKELADAVGVHRSVLSSHERVCLWGVVSA